MDRYLTSTSFVVKWSREDMTEAVSFHGVDYAVGSVDTEDYAVYGLWLM